MTLTIDFTKPARLLKATPGMYRHTDTKFAGLYLNVGKTKSTWYVKRRVECGCGSGEGHDGPPLMRLNHLDALR